MISHLFLLVFETFVVFRRDSSLRVMGWCFREMFLLLCWCLLSFYKETNICGSGCGFVWFVCVCMFVSALLCAFHPRLVYEKSFEMCICLRPEFGCPEVTLGG